MRYSFDNEVENIRICRSCICKFWLIKKRFPDSWNAIAHLYAQFIKMYVINKID